MLVTHFITPRENRNRPHATPGSYRHAPTIVELPDGDLLAAWYEGTEETAEDVQIIAARLPAGRQAWNAPQVIANTPGQSDGNPVLFLLPGGRLSLLYVALSGRSWESSTLQLQTSDDDGRTWSKPVVFREEIGWLGRCKPITLSSGRSLLPIYDEASANSLMLLSDDAGRSWFPSSRIRSSPPNIQPAVVERSDGSLLAYLRYFSDDGDGFIWQSVSADQGLTWSPATPTPFKNPNAAIDLLKTRSGELILAYNDSPRERTPLSVALSLDEGQTWLVRKTIETGPGSFAYPALIQTADDLLHMTYSYNYRAIKHVDFTAGWLCS